MEFELSSYQKDILDYYVKNPSGNMMINALAGSGKSTTACILFDHTETYSVYLAFNNSVAAEFKEKITNPKVKVYTIHSLAYAIMNYNVEENSKKAGFGTQKASGVKRSQLDNFKMYKIIDNELSKVMGRLEFKKKVFYKDNLVNLYNLCHLTLTSWDDVYGIEGIISDHTLFERTEDCDYPPPSTDMCLRILKNAETESLIQFDKEGIIDFTDMLWLTYVKLRSGEWKVPYWAQFYNIVVDECQDFNALQHKFLGYLKRKEGRYVFIGDEKQAITFYCGSDAYSYQNILKLFAPIEQFDLPICYRCAKSHLTRVNNLFNIPILPREDAPQGSIYTIEKAEIAKKVKSCKGSTMLISRKNKWLSDPILMLAKAGIPIYISDVELVKGLLKVVSSSKATTVDALKRELKNSLESYSSKISKLSKEVKKVEDACAMEDNEYFYSDCSDEEDGDEYDDEELPTPEVIAEAEKNMGKIVIENAKMDNTIFVLAVLESYIKNKNKLASKDAFNAYLTKILNTKPTPGAVRICSVHKAKGLEADNVFVMNEGRVCFDFRNGPEQDQQEKNLSYISITRAKLNLFLVREGEKKNGKKRS